MENINTEKWLFSGEVIKTHVIARSIAKRCDVAISRQAGTKRTMLDEWYI